jgi:hypothetical protein
VIVICARPEAVIEEIQEAYSDGAIADLPLKKTTSVTGNGLATRFGGLRNPNSPR